MSKLPPLTPEREVTVDFICNLFFKQLMLYARELNGVPEQIPDENFADFLLYAMKKELDKKMEKNELKS